MSSPQRNTASVGARDWGMVSPLRNAPSTAASSLRDETGQVARAEFTAVQSLLKSLNDALTAELVCAFRRRDNRRWYAEFGGAASSVKSGARCCADFELADRLAERIVQLGGHPEFALDVLDVHGHGDSKSRTPINDRLSSDLAAERTAVAIHQEVMARLGTTDLETSRLLYEFLLADEVYMSSLSELWWSCQREPDDHAQEHALGPPGVRETELASG
jgi:bacterioferritin